MIENHFHKDRLEQWCKKLPECSKFLKQFFSPIKARVEMHKTLMNYLDNISECMTDDNSAQRYGMTTDQFRKYHNDLMQAYHDIIVVDANLKKTVY
jgi:hypothetical protein